VTGVADPSPRLDPGGLAERDWRLPLGGELVPARSGRTYTTSDPATERPLAAVPDAGDADVEAAVAAAEEGARLWRSQSARERGAVVRELAGVLRANAEELAWLDAVDGGFPITNMRDDVERGAGLLELFADWAIELKGETVPATAEHLHYTVREPFGVVARIVPFNHPIFFAAGKIAAPLVAGNAVILKPADQTPLSALRMGELFSELLPPGVLGVLTGQGPEVGRGLVVHPRIRRLAFIGSEVVGRAIQRDAAEVGVKDVTLELGGKNAMVVFPDADLDAAANGVVSGMNFIGSQGQSCGSNSRVLLHREVAEPVVERVVARLEALRLGSPLDPATEMGPVISDQHRGRVLEYVDSARSEGATLATGGGPPAGQSTGYYVAPTLFTDVTPEMRIAREEIFGPVVSVMPWEDPAEAVRLANGVDYGLTASVWTSDLRTAHRVARELEAGYVWINGSSRHFWGLPFGGVKSSGVGREESLEELLSFTQLKTVNVLLD
jgi:2-formylbenzoate dehydrogenase